MLLPKTPIHFPTNHHYFPEMHIAVFKDKRRGKETGRRGLGRRQNQKQKESQSWSSKWKNKGKSDT